MVHFSVQQRQRRGGGNQTYVSCIGEGGGGGGGGSGSGSGDGGSNSSDRSSDAGAVADALFGVLVQFSWVQKSPHPGGINCILGR